MASLFHRFILLAITFLFCFNRTTANLYAFFIIPQNATEFCFENHFKNDTDSRTDFGFLHKEKGLKPYIAPALLITTGTILHFSTHAKRNFQDWAQENFGRTGRAEDYLLYVPGIAVYGLNGLGAKGKNNFGNRTALLAKSFLLNEIVVSGLKYGVNEKRPNGGEHSFPSGHTSKAFMFAHFMHKEYGDKSVCFSIGAYSCATTIGVLRVVHNAHWISDVVASAGIGMLSTELVYLTHQYKWDKEHLRRLDIFPWSNEKQKGVALVYTF